MASFSLVSSRSLVVPGAGLGGVPLCAAWWRRVVSLALFAGACRWRVRASARSFSGVVVVAGFSSFAAASAFASAFAGWSGLALAVRSRRSGSVRVFAVSVPVAWPGLGRPGAGSGAGGEGGAVVWVRP
jgi:hypothetical protein